MSQLGQSQNKQHFSVNESNKDVITQSDCINNQNTHCKNESDNGYFLSPMKTTNKNPINSQIPVWFIKQNCLQLEEKVLLYGDAVVDLTAIKNNNQYCADLQYGALACRRVERRFRLHETFFYIDSCFPQITDFSYIINLLLSLSYQSQQGALLAQRFKYFQAITNQLLARFSSAENNSNYIRAQEDPVALLEKAIILSSNYLRSLPEINLYYSYSVYRNDPDNRRLNRFAMSCSDALLRVISEDHDELVHCLLGNQIDQIQGDTLSFLGMSIPFQQETMTTHHIQIHTSDNYVIPVEIKQISIPVSQYSQSFVLMRIYEFQEDHLDKLKIHRLQRRIKSSKETSNSSSSSHKNKQHRSQTKNQQSNHPL